MSNFASERPCRLKSSRYLKKGRESNSPTYLFFKLDSVAVDQITVSGLDLIRTSQYQPSFVLG